MSNLFDVFFGRGIQNSHLISNIMIVTGCFVFCATLIIIVQDLFTSLQCEVCIQGYSLDLQKPFGGVLCPWAVLIGDLAKACQLVVLHVNKPCNFVLANTFLVRSSFQLDCWYDACKDCYRSMEIHFQTQRRLHCRYSGIHGPCLQNWGHKNISGEDLIPQLRDHMQ